MMIERTILLVGLIGVFVLGYCLLRCYHVRRAAKVAPSDPLLAEKRPGIPAILYFTTPMCAPCRTQQRPALTQLVQDLGDQVQVIEVNALEQPDAADRWGVLSVPTTFILDGTGRPRQVNHGVAGLKTLKHQLQNL